VDGVWEKNLCSIVTRRQKISAWDRYGKIAKLNSRKRLVIEELEKLWKHDSSSLQYNKKRRII
jgi:hypothetical protein